MRTVFIYIFLSFVAIVTYSQDKVLTYQEYMAIVREHHPITYQANLTLQAGEAYLLKARGAFDPKLQANYDHKNLKGTNYYTHLHAGLKVPTWYGITLNADYDNNSGYYLNDELVNGPQGIVAGGVSVTLGKGLFMDNRRAELKQAKIYLNSSQQEQKIILNQLLFNASVNYWYWQKYYREMEVYKSALENAKTRLKAVKQSVVLGDKPAIDSIETKTFVQTQQINYKEAVNNFKNYTLKLSVFLWQDGFIPLEIDSTIVPGAIMENNMPADSVITTMDSIVANHPEIILGENKVDVQQIETRLMNEALRPTLNLKYNVLSEVENSSLQPIDLNNNKFGAYFSYPIFIRKERGNVKLAKLKTQEYISGLELKKAELRYKITSTQNTAKTITEQRAIAEEAVKNYNRLMQAETQLFGLGESSIFLINYREQSLIKAKLKAIELAAKQNEAVQAYKAIIFQQ